MPAPTTQLTCLTHHIPGVGGRIKHRPEDFLVAEQPLYQPSGQGEHVYLFIEKRNQSTSDVVRRLGKLFRVGRRDIGYAGLKDKFAVTQQWFSVLQRDPGEVRRGIERMEFTPFKLIRHARHGNKLRRGHLKGNRFVIRIRDAAADGAARAREILQRLAAQGVPNFVGEQRFGYRHNNHQLGRLLLLGQWQAFIHELLGRPRDFETPDTQAVRRLYERGEYQAALDGWPRQLRQDRQALDALRRGWTAQQAAAAIEQQQREFLLSAMQSHIFNQVLNLRLREGCFDQLLPGDLAWKHDSRAVFLVDQPAAQLENAPGGRVQNLDISPSGPMWGPDMIRPEHTPLQNETAALHAFDLSEQDLNGNELARIEGSRRPLRIPLSLPELTTGSDEIGAFLRVSFDLPRGAFATIVLREIMKNDVTGDDIEDE